MRQYRQRWDKPTRESDRFPIYREFSDGTTVYWTEEMGERTYVARAWAENEVWQGRARYVNA